MPGIATKQLLILRDVLNIFQLPRVWINVESFTAVPALEVVLSCESRLGSNGLCCDALCASRRSSQGVAFHAH